VCEAFNNLLRHLPYLTPPIAIPAISIPWVSPRADTTLTNGRSKKRKSRCADDETSERPQKKSAPMLVKTAAQRVALTDAQRVKLTVAQWVQPLKRKKKKTSAEKGALELKRDHSDSLKFDSKDITINVSVISTTCLLSRRTLVMVVNG